MDDFKLLIHLNFYHRNEIAQKVVAELKNLRDKEFLLSGDSGLKNVWAEICSQGRSEQSVYWDAYVDTMENFIVGQLVKQPEAVKRLISYIGSLNAEAEDSDENGMYEYCEAFAVREIMETLMEIAGD